MTDPARIPVIVGIGEVADRPDAPGRGPIGSEPAAMMAEALRRADHDAGGGWPCANVRCAQDRMSLTTFRTTTS